jgi:hypothetical protein
MVLNSLCFRNCLKMTYNSAIPAEKEGLLQRVAILALEQPLQPNKKMGLPTAQKLSSSQNIGISPINRIWFSYLKVYVKFLSNRRGRKGRQSGLEVLFHQRRSKRGYRRTRRKKIHSGVSAFRDSLLSHNPQRSRH